ncbi:hypothetical protein GA0116948_102381 [Chitinophaga costaii]|uniref:Uncharacterized protein n=1 Tax=Chitinophaga costaii TaxID=1335309 RepID=A0A1C4B1U6_9BACT|nr:hypothetical protein [Chitinophaga costaii]SCC00682.1 hypothetical protein GA0116948_102381 [Chitinophaga costaii]
MKSRTRTINPVSPVSNPSDPLRNILPLKRIFSFTLDTGRFFPLAGYIVAYHTKRLLNQRLVWLRKQADATWEDGKTTSFQSSLYYFSNKWLQLSRFLVSRQGLLQLLQNRPARFAYQDFRFPLTVANLRFWVLSNYPDRR